MLPTCALVLVPKCCFSPAMLHLSVRCLQYVRTFFRCEDLLNLCAPFVGSEATASLSSPRDAKVAGIGMFGNQATGRSFMGNMMDTLLLKNMTFRNQKSKAADPGVHNTTQVIILSFLGDIY